MRPALAALALVLASCAQGDTVARPTFVWQPDREWEGGFSAIHVFPGGDRALVLSDRAFLLEFILSRDGAGDIAAVEDRFFFRLPGDGGGAISPDEADSEGLAVTASGDLYVSFERNARVRREVPAGGPPEILPQPREFLGMQPNGSLEALAVGPDGALYTIPERSGRADRPFPVYRFRDGAWEVPFTLPRRGAFLVAGADIGPDGRLYILERDFTGLGFRSRVRRFDLDGGAEETVMESGTGVHDNLEGISVWRQGDGRLRMTMVADDNYRWFQETQIVEYVLDD